ncbi:MAG TPA: hypothetical protein VGI50_14730 [Solirubrobacteraceae bacterium]
MSTIAHRRRAARRATLGTTAAIAGLMTAGVSAAFIALLLNDQSCSVPDGMPSAEAQHAIPPLMLAAYQAAAVQYRLPWELLAGIGKEECDNGLDTDPSCAIQPGAQGPGVANSAGASGPMQIGVGGLAGDEYQTLRQYLPAGQQDLGPHDPTVAVELAALVLIRDKGAPTGRPIDTYLPYARAYNGTGPAADAYASRVIADAHQYEGGNILAAVGVGCAAAQDTYVNPFSRATDLVAERIDMGVDYSGRGPILALGDAKITYATTDDPGWAYCGAAGAITLQLVDGPNEGRDIYIAEGIAPTVAAGQTVTAGQTIAEFAGAGCIEIGWSTIPDGVAPEAAALGQQATGLNEDPGDNLTYCGNSMSELLASLGAPPGLSKGRAVVGDRC